MITINADATPLDIAEVVASRFTVDDTRIWSLREVATRYAKIGDTSRGVAVLAEARTCLDRQNNQQHYLNTLELPSFATDYHALGRSDLALQVIDASTKIAGKLRPRFAASILAVTAEAAFEIGEEKQCRALVERVLEYVHGRKRFRFNYHDRFDQLVPLLLNLGMDEEAVGLAEKMIGPQRANALAELAKFSRGEVREGYLQEALRIARERKSEYCLATIAEVLGSGGEFIRAREIIAEVKQQHVRFEALIVMAVQYCEAGRHGEAVAVLEELMTADQTFFYYHQHQLTRLITLLLDGHADAVRKLLDRIKLEATKEKKEKDRLLRLTRWALVAIYSEAEAEGIVDQVLDARLEDLNRRERGWGNNVVQCIMFELLLVIVDHQLRWDEDRRESFRAHLALPVRLHMGLEGRARTAKKLMIAS